MSLDSPLLNRRPPDKLAAKAQKITIKLPWEIMTMFSDVLPTDDEEDEDDVEAHEASLQRLKVCYDLVLSIATRSHACRKQTMLPVK